MSINSVFNPTGVTQTSITGGSTVAAGGNTKITILGKDWTIPVSWIDGFSDAQIATVINYLSTKPGFKVYFDGTKDEPNNALIIITTITTAYRKAQNIPFSTISDPGLTQSNTSNSSVDVVKKIEDTILDIPGTISNTLGLDKFIYIGIIVLAIIVLK